MKILKSVVLAATLTTFPSFIALNSNEATAATCVGTYENGSNVPQTIGGFDGGGGGDVSNVACGSGAVAAGDNHQNTAIGNESKAGMAIGGVTGSLNTALGANAKAGNATPTSDNTAIGNSASADGGNSTAIGANSIAAFVNSTAIGAGAQTTKANQIVLGTAANSYTLPGLAAAGGFIGSSNQSGATQVVTVDGDGNLGTTTSTSTSASTLTPRVEAIENSMKTINSQIENVGAMAAAFSSIPNLTSDNRRYGCGIGTGGYGSGWAGAAGCASKIGSNTWINGAIAFTGANSTPWGSTSSVAGRIGLFYQWGGVK